MMPKLASILTIILLAFTQRTFSDVIDLLDDSFDSVVDGSKNVLVEFFAPW